MWLKLRVNDLDQQQRLKLQQKMRTGPGAVRLGFQGRLQLGITETLWASSVSVVKCRLSAKKAKAPFSFERLHSRVVLWNGGDGFPCLCSRRETKLG